MCFLSNQLVVTALSTAKKGLDTLNSHCPTIRPSNSTIWNLGALGVDGFEIFGESILSLWIAISKYILNANMNRSFADHGRSGRKKVGGLIRRFMLLKNTGPCPCRSNQSVGLSRNPCLWGTAAITTIFCSPRSFRRSHRGAHAVCSNYSALVSEADDC